MMTAKAHRCRDDVRRLLDLVINQPEQVPGLSGRELDLCLRIARRARLLGRLAVRLDRAGLTDQLPSAAADQLIAAKCMASARARLALWELDRVAWALRGRPNTPLIAMKGCAYLLLDAPNAAGRVFADVDLMTTGDALEDVESELNAYGWHTKELSPYDDNYYRRWTHELPPLTHRDREMEVDLHHNVLPRTARLKPSALKLIERSRPLRGSSYRVLADEDIVLHAMAHLMSADDLADKLRDLVDISDLLTYFTASDDKFWSRLVERAPALDLDRPAYYSLRYLDSLIGLSLPEKVRVAMHVWAPRGPAVWLMDWLAPRALYPQHPDFHDAASELARFLLYVRSHWIRMPPWLLVYHLTYKFLVTRFGLREHK